MSWIEYKRWDYSDSAGTYLKNCDICVDYDDTSETPTSLKIRFRIEGKDSWYTDSCYILYNPSNTSGTSGTGYGGTLYSCKPYSSNPDYPYTTSTITLTKTYTDSSFTLSPFWACNNGQNATSTITAAAFNKIFHPTYKKWSESDIQGGRRNYAYRVTSSTSMTVTGTKATSVTAYTPTIEDLYHGDGSTYYGSCKIVGKAGAKGDYNNVNKTTLQYKIGSGNWINATSLTLDPLKLTDTGTGNVQTVKARTVVDGAYNDKTSSEASLDIRRYKAPTAPGRPELTEESFKNGRLTVKLPWIFTWTASSPGVGSGTTNGTTSGRTTSKVLGYRVYMEKKTTNGSWTTVKLGTSTNYLTTSTNSVEIDPLDYGINAKESIRVKVSAYTKTGSDNTGTVLESSCSSWGPGSSTGITVQNAGVMRIKPNSTVGWKEGVVWVKVRKDNVVQWVEADIVKIKTDSTTWSEST